MDKNYENLSDDMSITKHYIKDLSFENFLDVNIQKFDKNNTELNDKFEAVLQTHNNDKFSVLLKYSCDCRFIDKHKNVFILEIDYFGLFTTQDISFHSKNNLVKEGCVRIYPILKPIVENIIRCGAPINVSLKEPDFNLVKA